MLLDRDGSRFLVHVRGKQVTEDAALRAMAGEFENELLAQALRLKVARANQRIIEGITALAISGAAGFDEGAAEPPLIDVRDPADDGFLDDPMGLGKPWEAKKHGAE